MIVLLLYVHNQMQLFKQNVKAHKRVEVKHKQIQTAEDPFKMEVLQDAKTNRGMVTSLFKSLNFCEQQSDPVN